MYTRREYKAYSTRDIVRNERKSPRKTNEPHRLVEIISIIMDDIGKRNLESKYVYCTLTGQQFIGQFGNA